MCGMTFQMPECVYFYCLESFNSKHRRTKWEFLPYAGKWIYQIIGIVLTDEKSYFSWTKMIIL